MTSGDSAIAAARASQGSRARRNRGRGVAAARRRIAASLDGRAHRHPAERGQGVHRPERPSIPSGLTMCSNGGVEEAGAERVADRREGDAGAGENHHPAPAGRREPTVGEQQDRDAEQPEARGQPEVLQPRGGVAARQPRRDAQRHVGVLEEEVADAEDRAHQAEDRPDPVPGRARADQRADGRERQRGEDERRAAEAREDEVVGRRVVERGDDESGIVSSTTAAVATRSFTCRS